MIVKWAIDVAEIQRIASAIKPDAEGYPATAKMVYSAIGGGYSVVIDVLKDESLVVIIETEVDAGTTGTPYRDTSADEVDGRPMTLEDLDRAVASLADESTVAGLTGE